VSMKNENVNKVHIAGVIISLSMLLTATVYGYFSSSALLYSVIYAFRALGLYLLFYCFKCYHDGKENFVSAGWTEKEFSRENYPYQFLYLLIILLLGSFCFSLTWFTVDI
jgi:formate/nitrite transporter FocA (FNT family)